MIVFIQECFVPAIYAGIQHRDSNTCTVQSGGCSFVGDPDRVRSRCSREVTQSPHFSVQGDVENILPQRQSESRIRWQGNDSKIKVPELTEVAAPRIPNARVE